MSRLAALLMLSLTGLALLAPIGFIVVFVFVVPAVTVRNRRRARAARDARVSTASAEAAEDDPAFAAPAVRTDAAALYVAIEGAYHLDAPIVASPWSDDARMADESLVELATADAPPAGVAVSELVSVEFEGTAREAALDLALAEPRCAPDMLEVAARRAVEAWAGAVDGDDAALLLVAAPQAAAALLYPRGEAGGNARVVVRGPHVLRLAITALHADRGPPRMDVEARLRGRRYLEDRDTAAVLSGSKDRAVEFAEHWTFSLEGTQATPWLLVSSGGAGA